MLDHSTIDEVNRFWFEELRPEDWFKKSEERDETIKQRFAAIYDRLREGVPASWLETLDGHVAAIVVLDQFPRNLFRGEKRSFATDPLALELAKQAIANGIDESCHRSSDGRSICLSSIPKMQPTRCDVSS